MGRFGVHVLLAPLGDVRTVSEFNPACIVQCHGEGRATVRFWASVAGTDVESLRAFGRCN
jgi:hypothetical protein